MTIADQPPTHDMREADTILRELVEAVRSVNTEQESEKLAGDWPAWAAAFAWADAQKAPQLRTAEPANTCKLTECQGKPRCGKCKAMDARAELAPAPADEPPPLPEPVDYGYRDEGGTWVQQHGYTADQMRARDAYWIAKLQAERSKPI
jgi:hypothetical protein